MAENEDKISIFDGWCNFLNFFDTSVEVQFTFLNMQGNEKTFEESIVIAPQEDNFNSIREEYSEMLRKQLSKGNNGVVKRKFITFGIHADSYKKAKPRLERLELDIFSNLKKLGVRTETLDGKARLELFHHVLHMNEDNKFKFDWKWLPATGYTTKDFVVPSSFYFGDGKFFKLGDTYGAASFLEILAPELSDEVLSEYLEIDGNQVVTMHVQSVDHVKAIKMIKGKLSDLEKTKIDEQKKAVRQGYDMDVLPSDLGVYVNEAKKLLQDLQSRNERLFYFQFIVVHTAKTKEALNTNVFQAVSLAQKQTCLLHRLDYQQEQGFFSCLPLGKSFVSLRRCMTSTATGGFMPFTTSELFQDGNALYYGINALSNNLLMADRKRLKNPNGLILGTPGSGKSFSAKREIVNVFLMTDDDITILDPEAEYAPVVQRLEGQVIKISPLSKDFINPMDINLEGEDGENPLIMKSDFILSLFELMMGEVKADEKSIIDNSLQLTYMDYFADPKNTPMPILEDLFNTIRTFDSPQARHIADCMAIYVTGSLNVFNNRTNVNVENRVVCYDIKELGNALREFGMLVVQDQVWGRVSKNREQKKSTRYYIDEMHLLLSKTQTANYTVEIWKRFRKWGGIPTGLTQNVKDFLQSPQIANIFENSDFVYLLNQAGGDREILAKTLNISTHQLSHVKNSNAGEGLLIYGSIIIPFVDHFPTDTELYRIMTTKLDEVEGEEKQVKLPELPEKQVQIPKTPPALLPKNEENPPKQEVKPMPEPIVTPVPQQEEPPVPVVESPPGPIVPVVENPPEPNLQEPILQEPIAELEEVAPVPEPAPKPEPVVENPPEPKVEQAIEPMEKPKAKPKVEIPDNLASKKKLAPPPKGNSRLDMANADLKKPKKKAEQEEKPVKKVSEKPMYQMKPPPLSPPAKLKPPKLFPPKMQDNNEE